MDAKLPAPELVDAYIQSYPEHVRLKLQAIRAAIKTAVPEASEKISYGMPGFMYKGPLMYFAAFPNHIGIYPTPNGVEEFKSELSGYKQGKGSVQIPVNEAMPLELIARIALFRAEENRKKESDRKKRK
ncbi:MAG: DUF1801 domain-containing protein [Eubacteriales bacterium]